MQRERERERETGRETERYPGWGIEKFITRHSETYTENYQRNQILTQITELRTRDCNRDDHSRVKNDLGDRTGITAPDLSPRDESGTLTLYSCTL